MPGRNAAATDEGVCGTVGSARGTRRARSLAVVLVLVLACGGTASAADVGANDDTGKFAPDGGAAFYAQMASLGLRQAVVTVRWQPSDPLALAQRPLLDLTVTAARASGLDVVFATYPYPPRELEAGVARPEDFGAWVAELARRYPDVHQFVVGNEPNQPAFWRPQFSGLRQASAASFGRFLAAGYDALKTVDPTLVVVGVGLSPRGNDRPTARNNVSTSPIRFLAALGAWYRASGRTRPLMDGLSFHPYPNVATDPLDRGYPWPNAGFANLDRVKQALWDAFSGTGQPTTMDGLRLYLDEVGWQVDTTGSEGYLGAENVRVTDEATQAVVYGELVRRAACDPDVAQVNVFGFHDDPLRSGFQAGLYRVDGTARAAADAVRTALAAPPDCASAPVAPWRPGRAVLGAKRPVVRVTAADVVVELTAGEAASGRVCLLAGVHTLSSASRVLAGRRDAAAGCTSAVVVQNRTTTVRLPRLPGVQTLAVRLAAETNPARSTAAVRQLR